MSSNRFNFVTEDGEEYLSDEGNVLLIFPDLYESNIRRTVSFFEIPTDFDNISNYSEGLAVASKDDKYGFIDKRGKVVIPFIYEEAGKFSEGLACVKNENGFYGYIDKLGNTIIPFKYALANAFNDGLAKVLENGMCKYINRYDEVFITLPYSKPFKNSLWTGDFKNGLTSVYNKSGCGFMDRLGVTVIPCIYKNAWDFSEGLSCTCNGKYCGYLDKHGKVVIPFIYDDACSFSEGMAWVKKNGKYGYIDKFGNVMIPFIYDKALPFSDGVAWVKLGNKYICIDQIGDRLFSVDCDKYNLDLNGFNKGLACVRKNSKYGMINKKGNIVIPFMYDYIKDVDDNICIVVRNGKYSIIKKDVLIENLNLIEQLTGLMSCAYDLETQTACHITKLTRLPENDKVLSKTNGKSMY